MKKQALSSSNSRGRLCSFLNQFRNRCKEFKPLMLTIAALGVLFSVFDSASAQPAFMVVDLGAFGGSNCVATGINDSGIAVGTYQPAGTTTWRGFIQRGPGLLDLGTLGGTTTHVTGINNSNEVVGYSSYADGSIGAFLYRNGVMTDLGTISGTHSASGINSEAFNINDSGQIVGLSQGQPFLYSAGVMIGLGTLPNSFESIANGINNSGAVVGEDFTSVGTLLAFLYTNGVMTALGNLGGSFGAEAKAINNQGQIVGLSYLAGNATFAAFLYSNGNMSDLGTLSSLGGTNSQAVAINDAGQIVGGFSRTNGLGHAFYYSNGTMYDLNDLVTGSSGLELFEASAINSSGYIAAAGAIGSQSHACILIPNVSPAVGSLQVTISPAEAVNAGAQWQVDGGASQSSGATVSGLSVANHTVSFTTISGWTTPSNQTLAVTANQTNVATGTYVQQFGSLEVTISPAGAVSAGAQWQVDGDVCQTNGATVCGLTVGSHTLGFSTVAGWITPASQTVTVISNQTAVATGIYSLEPTLPPVSGCAIFTRPTDTILINGHTLVTNQMTIEAVIQIPSSFTVPTYGSPRIFEEQLSGSGDKQFWASPSAVGGSTWVADNQNNGGISLADSIGDDVWDHLAFVHDSNEVREYLDGVQIGKLDFSGDPSIANSLNSVMSIGAFLYTGGGALAQSFIGAVQWVRVSCVARYSGASITPPVTVPPSDAFTQVLFDFSHLAPGTSTVYDLSPNHFTGVAAMGFSGATAPSFVLPAPPAFQTVTQANRSLTLTWSTVPGQIYQIQYTTNLTQANWNDLGHPLVATNGVVTVSDNTCSDTQRFYRVVQSQ